jgi:hypothetical protein
VRFQGELRWHVRHLWRLLLLLVVGLRLVLLSWLWLLAHHH